MSLYTPVFPSIPESDASRKVPPGNAATIVIGKQQSYVELLRDIHLFLSTQSDMMSPPSRPNSPLFDRRVQKVKDEIQSTFEFAQGNTSSGKWTRISQSLKLGCVRGTRYWSVSGPAPCAPDEDTHWILPDDESEWIEWEKKREENRRLKGKTNMSQQIGTIASAAHGSQRTNRTGFTQRYDARERPPRDVSPTTLRVAKEKVRKWQASMASARHHDTPSGSSPASSRAIVAANSTKDKVEKPQRSRTLGFAIVKPAAKSIIEKRGKSSLSHPGIRGGSAPIPSHKFKSSIPSNAAASEPKLRIDETGSELHPKASSARDDVPKIADISETPFLPPSFPMHLETSTPPPDSVLVTRAKPSPILPISASSSRQQLSTAADPSNGRQFILVEPHVANVSSCLPPQPPPIDTLQSGKRSRAPSKSFDADPDDPPVTPRAKRLRSLSRNRSTFSSGPSKSNSPNWGLDVVPHTQDDERDPNPSLTHDMEIPGMVTGAPCMGADAPPEKVLSPTKSVKSYFSAPDSDLGDSPMKANLLLESPVSPMLSYAQNPSSFLPQVTSTQAGKESPIAGLTNDGIGFSSQFDVERHVDRVSELLEREVDFEGWLRDVRTVEMSQE